VAGRSAGADVAQDGLPARAQAQTFPPPGLELAPGLRELAPVLELMLLALKRVPVPVPVPSLERVPAQVAAKPGAPGHAAPPAVVRAGHPAA